MKSTKRPYGREEVRTALIRSANELFGQKGPDAVSIRDVAKHAEVNHALVHRHFGSKEQLLRDVMKEHADAFIKKSKDTETVSEAFDAMFDLMAEFPAFVRIVAHLLLSGHALEDFVPPSRGISTLAQLIADDRECEEDNARLIAAMSAAFSMGWLLFEPFIVYAASYEGDVAKARTRVRTLIEDMITEKLA